MNHGLTAALVLAAVSALPASAADTAVTPSDSLDRAVAVFVASNMKIAVDNALAQLVATGVPCDTTTVRALINSEFAQPYDRAAHDAATATIERIMDARAREASQVMLAQAAAAEGARTLPDGLVIRTLREGDLSQPAPTPGGTVAIRYTGMLPDGTVFDAIGPGEAPMRTRVADLTPGMSEGLLEMHPGGRYLLTMPASLGYGEQGIEGVIPGGCALQFDIELVDVAP